MEPEVFKPKVDGQHEFAVAVPAGKTMFMIETYATREYLRIEYERWKEYAAKHGITKPFIQ